MFIGSECRPAQGVRVLMLEWVMVVPSLVEALTVREDRARARLAELREQVSVVEAELSRLVITRETVDEVLADLPVVPVPVGVEAEAAPLVELVPVMLAAQESGDATVLSEPYRKVLVVFAQAAGPLRCKQVCEQVGPGTAANHVEAMRSKLKRLSERGILTEAEPGLFALTARATR